MLLCKHINFTQKSLLKRSVLNTLVEAYPAGMLVFLPVTYINAEELLEVVKSNLKISSLNADASLSHWFLTTISGCLTKWTSMVYVSLLPNTLVCCCIIISRVSLHLCFKFRLKAFAWSFFSVFILLTYSCTHCKTLSNSLFPKHVLHYIHTFSAYAILDGRFLKLTLLALSHFFKLSSLYSPSTSLIIFCVGSCKL